MRGLLCRMRSEMVVSHICGTRCSYTGTMHEVVFVWCACSGWDALEKGKRLAACVLSKLYLALFLNSDMLAHHCVVVSQFIWCANCIV
jgi:hypothetical protein